MCLFRFVGDMGDCGASDHIQKKMRVDLVDFGPPDLDQQHAINSRPSISLVKSNACDLISHSANDRATRGCLTTL